MDLRASFRMPGEKSFNFQQGSSGSGKPPGAMFKALRRLHGHNLENQGLNDLTEAFQSFVTRARFFSVGKLRRTWSHSAVEFMKYRRLLPMLLADGQAFGDEETDSFDAALCFQAGQRDERRIVVSNISPRVTSSQLQSFFSQYGKVAHCSLPREESRKGASGFATLPKTPKNCGTATITFKKSESAEKAKAARPEELKFYDQIMVVSSYISKKKSSGKGMILTDDRSFDDGRLSRASSTQSLVSTSAMSMSGHEGQAFSLTDLPPAVLERMISFLPISDTVRVERVNKVWLEASIKSWNYVNSLTLARESDGRGRGFSKQNPLRNSHLRAILRRGGAHLTSLDVSGVVHLLDDKALEIVADHCPNLRSLDLSGVRAGWEALAELGDSLPHLTRLAYRDMANATDKHIWYLVRGSGKNLQFVDLRGCKRLRGRCFRLFGHKLEQLYLDGCSRVDEMSIEDLCTHATGLKEIRLNECYKVTDSNISMISRTMPDLQAVTLCGDQFENLSTSGLTHLSRLQSLVEIALDFNPLVSDTLLARLVDGVRGLKSLSLANAGTDQSITMKGLLKLGELKELEQIDLSSIAAVRSPVVVEVCISCKHLELIQLRNCIYLCDDGIVAAGRARNLRHMDLSGSILVTSNSVQDVIKAFPQEDGAKTVTIVVGGTVCDASALRVRGSRVAVDFSDFSALVGMSHSQSSFTGFKMGDSEDESSDDEFEMLTAQRSFYIDAVCGEDDSPLDNEKDVIEWATREAKNLGLIKN